MKNRGGIWARRAGLLTVSALLLLSNLAFFLWYRSTARERREALEARRSGLAQEVETREAEAVKLAGQRDRLSRVASAISKFYGERVGARQETLAPFVEELHAVLQRVGVSPAEISYTTAPHQNLPLTEMLMTFSFRHDYSKFKQLLAALESDRRWIVVRDIGLSRDPDIPGSVQVRMTLATYFSGEEKATPRASLLRSRRR